jgi:hypothetical protein
MRRMFLILAAILMAQMGLVVGFSGMASAAVVLSGGPPTGCSQISPSEIHLTQSFSAAGTGSSTKVQLVTVVNCTGYSSVTPTVTSLQGILKATIVLSNSGHVRQCSNFESSTTPVDVVTGGSGYVKWHAGGVGTVVASKFTYGPSGSYTEDSSGNLEMDITSNPAVGSFSGDPVTAALPTSTLYNACPLSAGTIAATGSTITL